MDRRLVTKFDLSRERPVPEHYERDDRVKRAETARSLEASAFGLRLRVDPRFGVARSGDIAGPWGAAFEGSQFDLDIWREWFKRSITAQKVKTPALMSLLTEHVEPLILDALGAGHLTRAMHLHLMDGQGCRYHFSGAQLRCLVWSLYLAGATGTMHSSGVGATLRRRLDRRLGSGAASTAAIPPVISSPSPLTLVGWQLTIPGTATLAIKLADDLLLRGNEMPRIAHTFSRLLDPCDVWLLSNLDRSTQVAWADELRRLHATTYSKQ